MTEEELKRNIDAGRKWLKANGFAVVDGYKDDRYFKGATWECETSPVKICEPDDEDADGFIDSGKACESCHIWLCKVADGFSWGFGCTPEASLKDAIADYDRKAELLHKEFAAILDEEGILTDER